jgi:hypothetical protein
LVRAAGAAALLAGAFVAAGVARADPSLIRPDVAQWVQAAQHSRADVWLLGDSIAGPLDAGFTAALASHFGLAGTGLGSEYSTDNGAAVLTPSYPLNALGRDNTLAAVPANRQSYVLSVGEPTTTGATPTDYSYGYFLAPGGHLDPQAAMDWHLWTASPTGATGTMQARLQVAGDNAPLQITDPVTTQTPANGLQHTVFHFDATGDTAGQTMQGTLIGTSNTSILYSRLLKPGATGATLTTWSYGGHGALDFYNDRYLGGPTSQAGRSQFLSAMTDGGSGKLMVVLEEGTNDSSILLADKPSVHGIFPGNSPAAFQDNVASIMDGIRSDWAAAGKNPADLSFLVLGMYQYGNRTPDEQDLHRRYAQELEGLAQTHSDTSFVDLWDIAPTWDEANALGYMADEVHPTVLGATVYSQAIFDQLMPVLAPEPTAGLMLLAAAPLLLSRTRRPRGRDTGVPPVRMT